MALGKPLGSKRRTLKHRLSVGGVVIAVIVGVLAEIFLLPVDLWIAWITNRIASSIFHDATPLTLYFFLLPLVVLIIAVIVRAWAKRTSRR